jgi:hypothetical protein
MTTYFGLCDTSGNITGDNYDDSTSTATAFWNYNETWTCPSSGNQTVKEISCYCRPSTSANIRLAIYSADGNTKICEGTAEVAITGGANSWQGHMTQASITPNPATLVGGTAYKLVAATDANINMRAKDGNPTYPGKYELTDYTDGFPSSLPTGTQDYRCDAIRCGVDPAAGVTLDQAGFRIRNDDQNEASATWAAAENTNLSAQAGTKRARFTLNNTGDPTAINPEYDFHYKPSGGSFGPWKMIRK